MTIEVRTLLTYGTSLLALAGVVKVFYHHERLNRGTPRWEPDYMSLRYAYELREKELPAPPPEIVMWRK
jgi:hypothetical protein